MNGLDKAISTLIGESCCSPDSCIEKGSVKSTTMEKMQKSYVQYMKQGNTFSPVGRITLVDNLEPFAYDVHFSGAGIVFEKTAAKTDELYLFENSKMNSVLTEVKKFWTLKDNFSRLGYLHHRGILLFGPPGTGKSCLIQQVAESMVTQGDTIFFVKGVAPAAEGLKAFREIEPERRVVVVLEDLDEYIGYQERDLLQLLDGNNSVDNVLYLGSTNYIERFPPRLLRPGRFDKKIQISFPPVEGRLVYLKKKIGHVEEEAKIQDIATKTEGFSFGHLRELVIGAYAFQENVDDVIKRLKSMDYEQLPVREPAVIESIRGK